MENTDHNTENQEFDNHTLEDTTPEPTIDTDTQTADQTAESDKMAEESRMWQDKYTRLVAEFDNFRKRTLKEKMDLVASGGEDVFKAIIPIVDDFERAIAAMAKREDIEAEREGIRLIYQKFLDTLRSKGVVPIEAMGKQLDVDFHDAVAKIPAPTPEQSGTILDVVQTGYMLKDKVLRFARVVVGE